MIDNEESTRLVRASLAKRHRSETFFKSLGLGAIILGMVFLIFLFQDIIRKGYSAFWQTQIQLSVTFDPNEITGQENPNAKQLYYGNYRKVISSSLYEAFPDVSNRSDKKELRSIISDGAQYQLRDRLIAVYDRADGASAAKDLQRNVRVGTGQVDADAIVESDEPHFAMNEEYLGQTTDVWVTAKDSIDMLHKGYYDRDADEADRPVSDAVISFYDKLKAEGRIRKVFNVMFFTNTDSTSAELAGIWGALKGSFFVLLVTLVLSFPIGVAAAVYLEEFAPKNKLTDIIEVNINNLAAVPSIVFGLLGLSVFLNFFGLPRSAPIVGGMVLTLMTLPTIIISSRAALKSVPPSIKDAALGVGASKMQTISHHVLPLALPGMLTGTIIGMAQALGETAPLLMIGMIAFVMSEPMGIFDNATVMPVQIYLWADLPARGFMAKTSAAIMVLLTFLITMNAIAVFLRKRFETKW